MKRLFSLFLFSLTFLLVLGIGRVYAQSTHDFILFAGKDQPVGYVDVSNDSEYLYVNYVTDPGWCLMETHLEINDSFYDFPYTEGKIKNIIPGHFEYNEEHDCIGIKDYTIPLEDLDLGESMYIGAHAVVSNLPSMTGTIYATRTTGGVKGLYEIDMLTGTSNLLKQITGTSADVNNGTAYTNGLAFDATNKTLYFTAPRSVITQVSPLYSFVIGEDHVNYLCTLEGSVVGATFINNSYHYIAEGTNELKKITNIVGGNCSTELVVSGFGVPANFTFGDFVISPEGVLYGSTRIAPRRFFSLNISDPWTYLDISLVDALDLQLAYGSDGILYGINHGTGKFYLIDIDGTTLTNELEYSGIGFSDLASGTPFVLKRESAWAAIDDSGVTRFSPKGNWATYFIYDFDCNYIANDESFATSKNNNDGTITLEINVKNICGLSFEDLKVGLNRDFHVSDSVLGGTFYLGTASVPTSTDFEYSDGKYTFTLYRNLFSSRPTGYEDGWYRIWDIYVKDQLIEDNLELKSTYSILGDWDVDVTLGTKTYPRYINITSQNQISKISGFYGDTHDSTVPNYGPVSGSIIGRQVHMDYARTDITTDYTADFDGEISLDGLSISGTWFDNKGQTGTFQMFK